MQNDKKNSLISGSTENEKRLKLLCEIGRILSSNGELRLTAPQILETICNSLEFEIGELWILNEAGNSLRLKSFWHISSDSLIRSAAESQEFEFASGEGLPGRVWQTNAPIWIENIDEEIDFPRRLTANRAELKSGFAFPVLLGEKFLGTFCFFCETQCVHDEELLQMFVAVGGNVGQFIERERVEKNLRESEERYRAFIKQSTEGIWRFELDEKIPVNLASEKQVELAVRFGYLAECNDAMARMYGFDKAEDLIGKRIADLFDMQDAKNFEYLLAFINSNYHLINAESHEKDVDGNDKFFLNGLIGTIENEHLIRVWGTQRDVTESKQAEEKLRESEESFRTMADNAPVMIWVTDSTGYCNYLSQSWYEFTGQTPETGLGFGWLDATHPDDWHKTEKTFLEANKNHLNFRVEYRLRGADGSYIWAIDSAQPRFDKDRKFLGYIGSVIDITERKNAEMALKESQAHLALALKSGRAGTFEWDIKKNVNSWSPEIELLYGVPIGTFEGSFEDWKKRVVAEDGEMVEQGISCALEAKLNDYEYEFRAILPDHSHRWFAGRARFYYDENDEPLRMVGINIDITGRKLTEIALRDARLRLESTLNAGEIGTWTWDIANNAVYADKNLARMFSVSEADANGGKIENYINSIHFDDRQRAAAIIQEAIESGSDFEADYRLVSSKGDICWVVARGMVEYDANGKAINLPGVVLDITERKKAEFERERLFVDAQKAREIAERANHSKDEFIAIVSHELRSPLNAMLGWANILQRQHADKKTTEYALDVIIRNARSQSRLIEDLLDIARIGEGKLRLEIRATDPAPIIKSAIETIKPAAENKNIIVSESLEPTVGLVHADDERLRQVIENLLSNAVKFTPESGKIEISLKRNGNLAQIIVSDTGQGISSDFLPQIFERFRQADASTTRRHGGLGIGLSLARDLVELHGGTISAQSEGEGAGATFIVSLPLRTIMPIKQNSDTEGNMSSQGKLNGFWILAVDDEADAREIVSFMLQINGAKVTTANSAVEALEILKTANGRIPDILLSDISMPFESGYALLEKIRALPREHGGQIPAVALTAFNRPEDREAAFEAGFQKHLGKPVDMDALIDAIVETASVKHA